ncbi:MAG: flagellar basal body protein FliL [Treponema sp.]|nr:flagellar basal body protein FliL [Treponema sp.]
MADDDELGFGDDGGAAPAKKGGKVGGIFTGMLKWILIGVGAVILIVVVVFVTIRLVQNNTTATTVIPLGESYTAQREILDWYQSLSTIRTSTADEIPASVIVSIALGYKQGDRATSTEISLRMVELSAFLRHYFAGKTAAELRPQNEERLKIEIRNAINDEILSSSKIRDVALLQLDVIEQ